MQKLVIPAELCDLNEYIKAERSHKYLAARIKKENTNRACWYCKQLKPIEGKISLLFVWYTKNERKDPDNVAFAKKFILDALVKARVLENDGRKNVGDLYDKFRTDKENPRVEVFIHSGELCEIVQMI